MKDENLQQKIIELIKNAKSQDNKFVPISDQLKGEKAEQTIKTMADMLAQRLGGEVANDVVTALYLSIKPTPKGLGKVLDFVDKYLLDPEIERKNFLSLEIKNWIEDSQGWFTGSMIDRELGITSKKDKDLRRQCLFQLTKNEYLKRNPEKNGYYIKVEAELEKIDWRNARTDFVYDLRWPLELEKWVKIYPKNIIIVAGDTGAGKTAFILRTIEMNMDRHKINLFSSETGAEDLQMRLAEFDVPFEDWKFESSYRDRNFAEIIQPNDINIIDYLEITDNFFSVGQEIRDIFNKLEKGIAIIALQKKGGAEYGRGAEFSAEKARLYLSIDHNCLKIVKATAWATNDNPRGIKINFKLVGGCKFIKQSSYTDTVPF